MGRISLKPRRGRVSFFTQEEETFTFSAGHLIYRGPWAADRKIEQPLLDRGRIRGFRLVESPVPWMELSGFSPGLDPRKARAIIQKADGLNICWQDLGTLHLSGFEVHRFELRSEPGGALFELTGPVMGMVRRSGWVGTGPGRRIKTNKE